MMTVILLLCFNDGKDNHFFPPLKTILSFLLVIIVRRKKIIGQINLIPHGIIKEKDEKF